MSIPEVPGAEYSFDGITFSAARTVTAAPNATVTGYIRYATVRPPYKLKRKQDPALVGADYVVTGRMKDENGKFISRGTLIEADSEYDEDTGIITFVAERPGY